eukprot:TRINITY_DN10118_c0_g1_i5.p1 TRINITY_DN10118_c0_g1~~TRINITY_DN10118_c0_g1_i5.p1  ORF type:complete len:396 (+),score=28.73 TRINITY_DN10118_c0_g1_i5:183-1370(+)
MIQRGPDLTKALIYGCWASSILCLMCLAIDRERMKTKLNHSLKRTSPTNSFRGYCAVTYGPNSGLRIGRQAIIVSGDWRLNGALSQSKIDLCMLYSYHTACHYSQNYAPFPGHRRTNDVGWGCMLRSGQMMMAHALVQHVKGRDWQRKTAEDEEFELKLLTLFLDDIATTRHPLSIHRLVEHTTRRADLGVGVYHTPTAVVHALAYNINSVEFQDQLRDLGATNSLHVVVAIDAILSKAELYDKLNLHPDASTSILIMIPVLLGHGEIPATYQARLRACLGSELCVGFIGGQAKHALWFIGHNGDSWLGLDPHCCYPSLRHDALEHQWDAINNTYHTQKPSFIPSPKLDPNIALGFLVTDQADVDLVLDLIGGVKVCDYIHPALLQELDIFNFAG